MIITTKADIHDKIYYMYNNKIATGIISEILIKTTNINDVTTIQYKIINESRVVHPSFYFEDDVYLSKKELINFLLQN